LAPPSCSAFARTVARTAIAAEFTATSTGAITAAAGTITGTSAEFTATTSAALTAIGALAAVFAARLLGAGGRNEDGLGGNAEERGELALQRGPEADRGLDRDDDGFDLDARTVFATRAVFATRTIAFRARTTIAFRAGTTVAFGAGLATRTTFAFGARFTTFTGFTRLALFRSGRLGAIPREVLGQLRRVFDDADGRAGGLTIGGRGSGATGRATATELLRRRDGAGLGGGFGRGPDHGERREFRVGGLQLGFVEAGCGGADFIGACVRGGLVGGDWLLALGFFLAHVAYVGAAFVVADRMMRPFRCGAATRFVGPLVTEDEPPWGAEMTREELPERM
jgi:hypothetical protein